MDYRVQVDPDLVKAKIEAALLRAREDQLSEDQSGSYVDCPAPFIQYPPGGGDLGLVRSLRRDTYGDEEKTDLYCHGSASGKIGMAWLQGARKTMEDAHFAAVFQLDLAGRNVPVKFSVLCDGHGGDAAAKYVKKNMEKALKKSLATFASEDLSWLNLFNACKHAFVLLDYKLSEMKSGTTVNLCLQIDRWLIVANTGDSRAILVTPQSVRQLSQDAKPGIERFGRRIENRHGKVIPGKNDVPRVDGIYSVAGAVGDHKILGHMPARPQITIIDMFEPGAEISNGIMLQVCDGVTDVLSTEQLGCAAQRKLDAGYSLPRIAAGLAESTYGAGTLDNVSLIVSRLG